MIDTTVAMLDFANLGVALLAGEIAPPEMLIDDLIYAEGIHSIYSPGGTGKTILALWIALQAIGQGLTVVYIDEENGPNHITELLKHMDADAELVSRYFKYAPSPGLTKADVNRWYRTVLQVNPNLVVFDSFADHLALDGLSENTSTDVTGWIKNFAQPVKDAGGSVLILDHVAKDTGGKGARGSTAKLAKVDVAWKLTLDSPFSRDVEGRITLSRDKDRKGAMPYSRTFEVGGNGLGTLTVSPEGTKAEPDRKPLNGNHSKVYDALVKDFPNGAKANALMKASGISEGSFFRVMRELVRWGWVRKDKATGNYHPVDSGEEQMPF